MPHPPKVVYASNSSYSAKRPLLSDYCPIEQSLSFPLFARCLAQSLEWRNLMPPASTLAGRLPGSRSLIAARSRPIREIHVIHAVAGERAGAAEVAGVV